MCKQWWGNIRPRSSSPIRHQERPLNVEFFHSSLDFCWTRCFLSSSSPSLSHSFQPLVSSSVQFQLVLLSGSALDEFACCFYLAFIYKELLNPIKQNLQEKQNLFFTFSKLKCNLHRSAWKKYLNFIVNLPQMTLWYFWLNTKMCHLCLWDKRDSSAWKLIFLSSFGHPRERVNAMVSE